MEYFIYKQIFRGVHSLAISESLYTELKKSREILSRSLAIEEIYEIVISNYFEFEQEIQKHSIDQMIRKDSLYTNAFGVRVDLNKRLLNILAAVRSYIDSVKHNASRCFGNRKESLDEVEQFFSNEYDKNRYYRFMEAFRNYVQHRGLAIDLTQRGSRWTSTDEDKLLEYSLNISANRLRLLKDKKMTKKVLDEMGDKIDLKVAVRHYIERISHIHESVRNLISDRVCISRKTIEDAIELYKSQIDKNSFGVRACVMDREKEVESIPLLLEWDDIRLSLQTRNKKLVNLSKRYVTSVIENEERSGIN